MKNYLRHYLIWFLLVFSFLSVSNLAHAQNQGQEDELFATAQRAFDDGFHEVSIRYLEEFLPKFPDSLKLNQAKVLLGQCYFFKNEYSKALDVFSQVTTSENMDEVYFWMGETYLKLMNYTQAQMNYTKLLSNFPDSTYGPQALYSLGWSYFDQKECQPARDSFGKLHNQFPKHQLTEDSQLKIGECFYNVQEYSSAIEAFEAYEVLYPQSIHLLQVQLNIADAFYYMEKFDQALLGYEKVLKSTQDASLMRTARIGRIWCAIKIKTYDQAQKWLNEERLVKNNISNEDLFLAQGHLLYEKGEWDQAVVGYSNLISEFPNGEHRLEAYLGRGNSYYFLNKFVQAIDDYQFIIDHRQLDLDQDLVEKATLGLAWAYMKTNEIQQGVKYFQAVFDQSKNRDVKINALVQMADAYQDHAKFVDALNIYNDVLKDYSDAPMLDYVRYRQAIAYLKDDKVDLAIASFDFLAQNFTNSKYLEDVQYYLGVAQFKKGDWIKSIECMNTFLKSLTHPSDFAPEANYILAISYLNLKQNDESLRVFQKILRLYPDDEIVAKNSDIGIAKCQFELGFVKEAIKRFKLIVYKYPKTAVEQEALLWLAQYFMKNAEYAQAVDYYLQIIDRFSDTGDIDQIHYELGQAYELQGMLDGALVQYKAVSTKDDQLLSKVRLAIAGIFSKEFDSQRALIAYENIAKTNPDYARDAYLKMAQLFRNTQTYEKEIDVYAKALNVQQGKGNVSNAEIIFNMADTHEVMNHIDEALANYLKVPAQFPDELVWVVKSYLRVAKIFEDRKDWESAKVTYQKLIQLNIEESKYASERMDWMKKK